MKRRLGCLSPLGIAAAVLALLVVAGITLAKGGILFSPGPLNARAGEPKGGVRSHAEIQQCGRCHAPFWGTVRMADLCLSCHTEVEGQIHSGRGLHGRLVKEKGRVFCRGCHTEHKGPNAELTVFDPASFPHEATGFSLKAHQGWEVGIRCADCHAQEITAFDQQSCYRCHIEEDSVFTQAHVQTFGNDCLACHDGVDRFSDFNHNRQTNFPFTDAHKGGTCSDCHLGDTTLAALRDTPTTCVGCHQKDDAHQGRFGPKCETCHQATTWKEATFDHARTNFPLEGAHQEVKCEACHGRDFAVARPETACFACHQKDDAHNGAFGKQCETCHQPTAWEDVQFDYAQTRFPLTGKHARVACKDCHTTGDFTVALDTACVSCHADPGYHRGLFGTSCERCHSTNGWRPAKYNEPHRFPINHGAGFRGNTCQVCHPNTLRQYTCYGCHEHNPARIAAKHREEGIFNFQNCVKCHPTGREKEGGFEGREED